VTDILSTVFDIGIISLVHLKKTQQIDNYLLLIDNDTKYMEIMKALQSKILDCAVETI